MSSVGVNPPKTPVTKGSNGFAQNTMPNVCKMPGPPAPFVPTPLPNIGQSGKAPEGYSTTVQIEGEPVAIQGSSFKSTGDIASQGTGGGIVSSNVEGPTKFLGPGSFDVQIEGKNVQYLGDPMLNNCGPNGSPPNSATMAGEDQSSTNKSCPHELILEEQKPEDSIKKHEATLADKKATQAQAEAEHRAAQSAIDKAPTMQPRPQMSGLRNALKIAGKRVDTARAAVDGATANVESAKKEKKVVDEIGGKSYLVKCKLCQERFGDIDAINSEVAKEVKSSAAGYRPSQLEKLHKWRADGLIPSVKIHVAVPQAEAAALEHSDEALTGQVQPHDI